MVSDLPSMNPMIIFLHREVFDEKVGDLPAADAPLDELNCCDVCLRKEKKFTYAQIYCVKCEIKFCSKHEKVCR